VTIQIISSDRRSLRQMQTFTLNDHDFDDYVSLRLFQTADVVQIQIEGDTVG